MVMWKWLFWGLNIEKLKIQSFGRGRLVGQKDHYFRSYMTQENYKNSLRTSTMLVFYKIRQWGAHQKPNWEFDKRRIDWGATSVIWHQLSIKSFKWQSWYFGCLTWGVKVWFGNNKEL